MNGIDISHHQGNINLSLVPCDFVICKATQGTKFNDNRFASYMRQATQLGKLTGVYHYCSSGGAIAEAEHFLQTVKEYIGHSIMVLDWEGECNPNFGNPEYAMAWLHYVKQKTGIKPFLYMSKSVARQYASSWDESFPFWCAQYKNQNPTGYQEEPWTDNKGFGPWDGCAILQYSSKGRLPGYDQNLDLDKAYFDKNAWKAYATGQIVNEKPTQNPLPKKLPTLKKGAKGDYVKHIQTFLSINGYPVGAVDGIFGPKTEKAVKMYQKEKNLLIDGIWGPQCWHSVGV